MSTGSHKAALATIEHIAAHQVMPQEGRIQSDAEALGAIMLIARESVGRQSAEERALALIYGCTFPSALSRDVPELIANVHSVAESALDQ